MTKIRVIYYWKHYLTKAHYHCKRYIFYLPKSIGDSLDTSIDYDVQLIDKFIVLTPKGLMDLQTTITKLESESHKAKCDNSKSVGPTGPDNDVVS